jgi:hypothetical protein
MQLLQAYFWGEEEGKSMQPVLERVPLSLSLLHLLGWFLFPFSPRIGWSNNNFLLGLIMSLPI